MSNEAGDKKVLGNLRQLIDQVIADTDYKPSNPILLPAALEALYTAALAAIESVATTHAPNKVAITERQLAFDVLPIKMTRSFNILKASGTAKGLIADAETHYRKVLGTRKTTKTKAKTPAASPGAAAAPGAAGDTGAATNNSHSAAQTSYDNQVGNLAAYVAVLANIPSYNPNEADLKVSGLQALVAELQAKNDAVSSTFVPLSQARGQRDRLLYLNDDGVVNTALLVKAYVKGALGTKSQLYKAIKGLRFARQNKG